jgi:hypothetical protein
MTEDRLFQDGHLFTGDNSPNAPEY